MNNCPGNFPSCCDIITAPLRLTFTPNVERIPFTAIKEYKNIIKRIDSYKP